jgi:hypothetical protein
MIITSGLVRFCGKKMLIFVAIKDYCCSKPTISIQDPEIKVGDQKSRGKLNDRTIAIRPVI